MNGKNTKVVHTNQLQYRNIPSYTGLQEAEPNKAITNCQ